MIDLGLKSADMEKYKRLLVSHHRIVVTVALLNTEHEFLADLTKMLLGGQVDIDADATDSTRSASLELLDPKKRLRLDSDAPTDGSLYYTRMIRITYSVISMDRSFRVNVPLFTGPLSKVERNGVVLSITAVGKEKLAGGHVWRAKTYKKKALKAAVIKDLLVDEAGEDPGRVKVRDFKSVANRKKRLPEKLVLSLDKESTPWTSAKRVAKGMNHMLFYDGRGLAVSRRVSRARRFTFGERGALLSEPSASFDAESIVNSVLVLGKKRGKGKKAKRVTHRAVPKRNHPLSPWSLGRKIKKGGDNVLVPRFYTEVVSDDSVKTVKAAKALSNSILRQKLVEQVEVSFESFPIPHLEENDVCRLKSDIYTGDFRVAKMSIPLTANGKATMGYLKKVTPRRANRIKGTKKKNRTRRTSA